MPTYCIIQAPPRWSQPQYALDALVGVEFEYDPGWNESIRNDYPYLPRVPGQFIFIDVQVILKALRELRRIEALQHWRCFAAVCPALYIPRLCCEALADERF